MPAYLNYIIAVITLFAASLTVRAQDLLGIKGEDATSIGVYIKNIETGEVLYDLNSELALTPASVMKTLTSASALSLLGSDYRFYTPVVLRGSVGADRRWHGDLIIRASGDPTLESVNFPANVGFCDSIVAALKRDGITAIDGSVIVIQTMKDAGPVVRWEIEDIGWPYGAGHFDFNYHDNTVSLEPLTGKTDPPVPGLKVNVVYNSGPTELIRGVGSYDLNVYSRKPDRKKWTLSTTMPDPAAVMKGVLVNKLQGAGIKIGDQAMSNANDPQREIYRHKSPVATEILRSLMVRSDNLFAEGMLRALAPKETRDAAIDREKSLWRGRGLNTDCTLIFDGSGLTRGNRVQPRFIADMLEWMARSPMRKEYISFFPRAGLDGTMKTFLAESPLKGCLALKTGSMNAVQSYAGYRLDMDGNPTHVVVIFVNVFFCKRPELRKAVEELLSDIFL